jgi:hypothetical protein
MVELKLEVAEVIVKELVCLNFLRVQLDLVRVSVLN